MTDSRTARGGANGSRPYLLATAGMVGGALLLAVLVVLLLTLGEIKSTENHVAATDAQLERALALSGPVAEEAEPLAKKADSALTAALPAVRDVTAFLEPLADDGADASAVLDRLPLLQQRASGFVGDATVAVQLASIFLTDALNQDLVGKASDSHRILGEVLAVQRETLETQKESLRTQRASLQVQLRTSRKLSRSLGLQRGTLQHARSLDNKTGGEIPPD